MKVSETRLKKKTQAMPMPFFPLKLKAMHCCRLIKYIDLICVVCNMALKLGGR